MDKEYLGDGVYAHFDGYQIWLTTTNGIHMTNSIALEPVVWRRLRHYAEQLGSVYDTDIQPNDQGAAGDDGK